MYFRDTKSGTSRGPKVKGVRDLKSSKNVYLNSENSLFIAFSYYNFKKSRGSADPADPVLAGSLVRRLFRVTENILRKRFDCIPE